MGAAAGPGSSRIAAQPAASGVSALRLWVMQIEDARRTPSTAECGSLWVDILHLQVLAVPVATQQAWLGSVQHALRPGSHRLGHHRQPGELRVEQGCASLPA